MKVPIILFVFSLSVLFGSPAPDKNGLSPTKISVPKGPGSIQGLGNRLSIDPNSGTGSFGVSIRVPPGTAGIQPSIALSYNTGSGNGVLGFGWSLGVPFVSRQTSKGVPRYVDEPNGRDDDYDGEVDEPDELDRFVTGAGEELVPTQEGYYRAQIEGGFVRYKFDPEENSWIAEAGNGTKIFFGSGENCRLFDHETGRTYMWLVERQVDVHGNTIQFFYSRFATPEDLNQVYLKEIRYGPGGSHWQCFQFICFFYEHRPDVLENNTSGFIIRTGKRLKEILTGTQGVELPGHLAGDFNQDGEPDWLNFRYNLTYLQDNNWSFLWKVELVGFDGVTSLPPLTVEYFTVNPPPVVYVTAEDIIHSSSAPTSSMAAGNAEFLEINGDGLPDILCTSDSGDHVAYINQGTFEEPGTLSFSEPIPLTAREDEAIQLSLRDKKVFLADMNGDGIADLIRAAVMEGSTWYLNTGKLAWGESHSTNDLDDPPPSPYGQNPNVRTMDVDFDKRIDIVQSTDSSYRVWYCLRDGRFSEGIYEEGAIENEVLVQFASVNVYLADINGDRLRDIVR
ncbi:MAG: VCBS repeat-containing protein, partial [Deltaproteobacteria bacterium]|nr:VCBS repeat-containing protein [Deltaproteobacteria bacterium]